MRVLYKKRLPYSTGRILSQYFDLEHIVYVHPRTFGEARLLTVGENRVVWDLLTPPVLGLRLRNLIVQELFPPLRIRTRVLKGPLRGVEVSTVLVECGEETMVEEAYSLPLPSWSWLTALIGRWVERRADRIWEEDLRVGVCHGGWPGVPGPAKAAEV